MSKNFNEWKHEDSTRASKATENIGEKHFFIQNTNIFLQLIYILYIGEG